jgi:hypothetical protein
MKESQYMTFVYDGKVHWHEGLLSEDTILYIYKEAKFSCHYSFCEVFVGTLMDVQMKLIHRFNHFLN